MNENLEIIKNEVFKRRPVLKAIADKYSGQGLKAYVQTSWQAPKNQPDPAFLNCLERDLKKIYGAGIASQAREQVLKQPLVSTIDHLGIWNHPIFVNSALIYSLRFTPEDLVVTLPTESVSLNNTSSWSGCLLKRQTDGGLKRYSVFPDRLKTLPVFSAPAINPKNIQNLKKKLAVDFPDFMEILNINQALTFENFSSQACALSSNFWQAVFPSAPRLIYLPLETLIVDYLLEVFQDADNFLTRLILSPAGRDVWQKSFFKEQTFMFWGIDNKGRRLALSDLETDKAKLSAQLQSRKIYPASPLCFMALLSAGVVCVGGFTQTTWLSEVKVKFLEFLERLKAADGALRQTISINPTKNFAESSLVWLKKENKYLMPSGLDLYLTGRDYYSNYLSLAAALTLGQSLDLMLPTIYSVIVPKKEWRADFETGSLEREILQSLGQSLTAAGL